MGSIISRVKEINDLRFKPFPSRSTPMRVVQYGSVTVGVGKRGTLYHSGKLARGRAYVQGRHNSTLTCLLRLGVVSQEAVDEYDKLQVEREEREKRRSGREYHAKELEKLGVVLTEEQMEKLK